MLFVSGKERGAVDGVVSSEEGKVGDGGWRQKFLYPAYLCNYCGTCALGWQE